MMKIAILNNAANYLEFNINLAKYLELFNVKTVFLNSDKFISRQLRKNNLYVEKYKQVKEYKPYYNEESDLIKYFKRIYQIKNITKLIDKKDKEYAQSKNYFENNSFDYVLILNGAFNVETNVCEDLGIKCFFFEHGYFPNTIQMDMNGVNCNASFSDLPLSKFYSFKYKNLQFNPLESFTKVNVKYNILERYFFRLLDPQYNTFFHKFIKRKHNLSSATRRFKSFKTDSLEISKIGKFIFFPLQVNSDTQILLNSDFDSMYHAIKTILPELKKTGFKIIIKEHPMEVEPVDYSSFIDNEQVFLVKKVNLEEFIKASEFVVNINSSVGLQSIALYKKVVTLGKAFYNNAPSVIKYNNLIDKDIMNVINSVVVDKKEIDKYISHFKENIFIKGHFYNPTVDFFERIRNRLV